MLETMESRWSMSISRTYRNGFVPPAALWAALLHPTAGVPYREPTGDAETPVVRVRVNHGVWQTVCPWCASAQHASMTDRRFYCAHCCNAIVEHRTLPVSWPANVAEIKEHLERRPLPMFRNWEWDETADDLVTQDEHAITSGLLERKAA